MTILDKLQGLFPVHYRFGDILLINADCMDVMAHIDCKHFQLSCVDPPYMVNMSGGKSPKNGFKGRSHWDKMKTWDFERPSKEYFHELFRVSVNQIICGANYFTEHLPPSMGWVFWYKMQDNFSFSDGELIFTSFDCKTRIFKYGRGMESGFAPGGCVGPNIHSTQKPVGLYRFLFHHYAKPGQLILDTHGGSFSSAIAAHYAGLRFVGVELDQEYFDAAVKRFKQATRQMTLFGPEKEKRAKHDQDKLI